MPEDSKRGSNGGNARAAKLTKEQRSAIAKAAAAKRWGKKDDSKPVIDPDITKTVDGIAAGIKKSLDDILRDNGVATDADVLIAKLDKPPVLISGPTMQVPIIHKEEPAPPKPVVKRKKPMVKEFGRALSYAEKRLADAMRERAEAMGKVAMLNAEIPSLVQVVKALGGTVNPQVANLAPQYPMQPGEVYQFPTPMEPHPMNQAMPQINIPQVPIIPGAAVGGAMDLDYTPEDTKLPIMGGAWR